MEYTEFIFALAVIIIGIVRWFIENRNSSDEEPRDTMDNELPDWTWPTEEEEQQPPPPPAQSTPPPPPPPQQSQTPPTQENIPSPTIPKAAGMGSVSALQQKIADAKKRAQEAEKRREKLRKKTSSAKQIESATHTPHGVTWLLDPKEIRRAIIAREILGPPLALRDDPDSEIR